MGLTLGGRVLVCKPSAPTIQQHIRRAGRGSSLCLSSRSCWSSSSIGSMLPRRSLATAGIDPPRRAPVALPARRSKPPRPMLRPSWDAVPAQAPASARPRCSGVQARGGAGDSLLRAPGGREQEEWWRGGATEERGRERAAAGSRRGRWQRGARILTALRLVSRSTSRSSDVTLSRALDLGESCLLHRIQGAAGQGPRHTAAVALLHALEQPRRGWPAHAPSLRAAPHAGSGSCGSS
jgi:hypothetical protein